MKVPVLGAGGWGTALAVSAARAGQEVTLWARRPELASQLAEWRENRNYLPGVTLPAAIHMTSDLNRAVQDAKWALIVVPSVGVPGMLQELPRRLGLVLCAKGLAPDGGRLSELAADMGFGRVAVLSGPNHAEEVGRGLPAATVVASRDTALADAVQGALMSASLRVYTSSDLVGVELGGVLKNVMALAAGLSDGLQLGDNAKASLLTRGLREMKRYLQALGAQEDTVYGLSGLGDLIATATSPHSRNRAAGEALARSQTSGSLPAQLVPAQLLPAQPFPPPQSGQAVEGLRTAGLLAAWASAHGHDLPVVRAVAKVCAGEWTAEEGVRQLMERHATAE